LDASILGYVYQNGGIYPGNQAPLSTLPVSSVAHWYPLPDPMNAGLGMSWITPAVREIQGDMIASQHKLDLGRVVIVGHSAGGHLAMWAAARSRVPKGSPLYVANPLPVRGVDAETYPVDMTAHVREYEGLCGDSVITTLLGGTPSTVPDRFAQASPMALLPLGVPQVIAIGT
jgi:pimeloyl-ACP methyl ester carboxylesterase